MPPHVVPQEGVDHTEEKHVEKKANRPHEEHVEIKERVCRPYLYNELRMKLENGDGDDGKPKRNFMDKIVTIAYTLFACFAIPIIMGQSGLHVNLPATLFVVAVISVAWALGLVFEKISPLMPGLLGNLIVGLLARMFILNKVKEPTTKLHLSTGLELQAGMSPIQYFSKQPKQFHHAFHETSVMMRELAMAVLVMRAGLSFDYDIIKRVAKTCVLLTLSPCSTEVVVCGIFAQFILGWKLSIGTGILWGALLGCVLTAVTPGVIIPAIADIMKKGLVKTQNQKYVVTLLMAASGFDDVVAISFFSLLCGIAMSSGGGSSVGALIWCAAKGPIVIVSGAVVGFVLARMLVVTMSKSATFRVLVGFTLPYILNSGAVVLKLPAAGATSCIVFGLVAARQYPTIFHDVAKTLDVSWLILEPAMFALIGCEMDMASLDGLKTVKLLVLMLTSLAFRSVVSFSVGFCNGFNWRQSLFICVSWIPKATVQAAIGTTCMIRLNAAYKNKSDKNYLVRKGPAEDMITMAVLSILVTAPLGAFLMRITSEKLLREKNQDLETNGDDEEFVLKGH